MDIRQVVGESVIPDWQTKTKRRKPSCKQLQRVMLLTAFQHPVLFAEYQTTHDVEAVKSEQIRDVDALVVACLFNASHELVVELGDLCLILSQRLIRECCRFGRTQQLVCFSSLPKEVYKGKAYRAPTSDVAFDGLRACVLTTVT